MSVKSGEVQFAEYEFTAISSKTGRRIHQLFFGRLVAENGKIKCLREAREYLERLPGLAETFEPDQAAMHATPTVEYAVVLEGEIWLEVDDHQLST